MASVTVVRLAHSLNSSCSLMLSRPRFVYTWWTLNVNEFEQGQSRVYTEGREDAYGCTNHDTSTAPHFGYGGSEGKQVETHIVLSFNVDSPSVHFHEAWMNSPMVGRLCRPLFPHFVSHTWKIFPQWHHSTPESSARRLHPLNDGRVWQIFNCSSSWC